MKNLKKIVFVILAMMMFLPFVVEAEVKTEKPEANKEPIKVYMFRGETCQFCEQALKWFESIEEEYGNYFDLITYEVWYNQENSNLMQEIADFKGETPEGVPYVLVGKYSYPKGFAADSQVDSNYTMGEQLIDRILEEYQSDNRYDIMVALNDKPDYSMVVGIVAGVIVIGVTTMIIISRKQNS